MCTPDRLRRCKRRRGSAGHLVTGAPGDPSQGDSRWPHHAFAARLRNCNGGTNTPTSSRWRGSLTSSPVRSWFARRATRTRRLGRRSSVFGASGGPYDERSSVYRLGPFQILKMASRFRCGREERPNSCSCAATTYRDPSRNVVRVHLAGLPTCSGKPVTQHADALDQGATVRCAWGIRGPTPVARPGSTTNHIIFQAQRIPLWK